MEITRELRKRVLPPGFYAYPSQKRKKTRAFTVARDKKTKEIIKRNANECPLIRLPRELKDRIWTHVLGNASVNLKRVSIIKTNGWHWKAWMPAVCSLGQHEDSRGNRCADACYENYYNNEQSFLRTLRLHRGDLRLDLLRTCRHIYNEANPILWQTTTFIMNDFHTLLDFLGNRNAIQRELMKRLSLKTPLDFHWKIQDPWPIRGLPRPCNLVPESEECQLPSRTLLKKFRGLNTLHLHVLRKYWSLRPPSITSPSREWTLDQLLEDVLIFQACPWETVTVSLENPELGVGAFGCTDLADFAKLVIRRFRGKDSSGTEEQTESEA